MKSVWKIISTQVVEMLTFDIAASIFQNALIGKSLLLSVKTKRTMRIHDGLSGAFAFAEQICGLENLRVFQDLGTGRASVLIHYSPQFRNGYMAFYLNSPEHKVIIRDDDDNTIRIKGINVPLSRKRSIQRRGTIGESNSAPRSKSSKYIAGAKVVFCTLEDKQLFMQTFKDIQRKCIF